MGNIGKSVFVRGNDASRESGGNTRNYMNAIRRLDTEFTRVKEEKKQELENMKNINNNRTPVVSPQDIKDEMYRQVIEEEMDR